MHTLRHPPPVPMASEAADTARGAAPVSQEALLAFLSDPASYPHRPEAVRLVQTHISFVALAPPRVYKVKKPVALGFLDFSTLARRRYFCEEEVRLNRRLCSGIYRGVVPITRAGGRLRWGGGGAPVEYAVEMAMLGAEGFLDGRVDRGEAAAADLDRVAETLAAFYRAQIPSAEAAVWGRTERLRLSTDENFAQTEPFVGALLGRPASEAIRYATDLFLDAHARLLNRRRASGRLVDGHGDLRLEHVHLTPEAVCLYDCIEFSERLRYVDVANDVAFLAMDLDVHGRPDLARHFVARMAARLDDPELPHLANFYRGYRAYVRGKVEGMRSMEPEVPEDERAVSRDRARRFFQLALRYAVAGSEPLVVAVMGGVGTGKSTQARALGEALGWQVISSDRVRKEVAGVAPFVRGTEAERAALYAEGQTEATYAALRDEALRRAARGEGTVLDATFGACRHRDALREALAAAGVAHRFVEVTAPEAVVKRRLAERAHAADQVSDARLEDYALLSQRFEAPDALEDPDHVTADAGGAEADTTTQILKHLVRLRP